MKECADYKQGQQRKQVRKVCDDEWSVLFMHGPRPSRGMAGEAGSFSVLCTVRVPADVCQGKVGRPLFYVRSASLLRYVLCTVRVPAEVCHGKLGRSLFYARSMSLQRYVRGTLTVLCFMHGPLPFLRTSC